MGISATRSVRRDAHQCCCSSPCPSCPSCPSCYQSMDPARHRTSTPAHPKGPYDVPTANAEDAEHADRAEGHPHLLQTLMGIPRTDPAAEMPIKSLRRLIRQIRPIRLMASPKLLMPADAHRTR